MVLINALPHAYLLSRIYLMKRKKTKQNRFDVYDCDPSITVPTQSGLLPAPSDWHLATPNLTRNENILLVGSSTWGAGMKLNIKWRPNEQLKCYTMLTSFTVECGRDKPIYEYDEVWTQSLDYNSLIEQKDYVRKYSGQNITLEVLMPYRKYRLRFNGFMRDRQNNDKLVYVKLRSIIAGSGKLFDFKEQFDSTFVASQLIDNKQQKQDHINILNNMILHDRHEQSVQIRCVYSVGLNQSEPPEQHDDDDDDDEKSESQQEEQKLFCWGFHVRQFIQENNADHMDLKYKRVLAYFSSGSMFHLGSVERIANSKDEKTLRLSFGYAAPQCQLTFPIQQLDSIDWDQIATDSKQLKQNLKFKCDNIVVNVEPCCPQLANRSGGNFIDIVSNGKQGRAIILEDNSTDYMQDQLIVDESVSEYVTLVHHQQQLIDLVYLDLQSDSRQLDKIRPLVVSLDQQDCRFSSLCGAKAASLAQLLHRQFSEHSRAGVEYKVPNGIVLTRYAWDLILEANPNIKLLEQRLVNVVNHANKEDIQIESEQLRAIFSPEGHNGIKVNMPEQLINQLEKSLMDTFSLDSELALSNKPFAVRSSSWGEDDDDMSAAGQLTTLLSVRGLGQLCKAILICFASKYSLANLEYKHQRGLPVNLPMAIVIQEMIECDKAGVMFTCDPTNGNEQQIVITANYGLGESVVSAASDPDTILVGVQVDKQKPNDYSRRQLSSYRQVLIGKKKVIMTSDLISFKQSQEHGLLLNNAEETTPPFVSLEQDNNAQQQLQDDTTTQQQHDVTKCCLSEEETCKLANCGLELVDYFRCARDIEWGYKGGQLYLFQSRPVTGLDIMSDFELLHEFSHGLPGECEWLSRANVGEVMPLAMSPLSLSYSFLHWGLIFARKLMDIGVIERKNWYNYKSGEVATVGYFNFFNLRMSRLFAFEAGQDRSLAARAMEIGIFGHEVNEPGLPEACSELRRPVAWYVPFRYLFDTLAYRFYPKRMVDKTRAKVFNLRQDILEKKFAKTSSLTDLYEQMNMVLPFSQDGLNGHMRATMLSPEYNQQLVSLLSKFIDDPAKLFACYSKLLSSQSDVFSARVPHLVNEMSMAIADKGVEELKMFLAMNENDSIKYMTSDDSNREHLKKLFDKFMNDYGHRSYNEFDLSSQRWRENPNQVIDMIKQSCQNQLMELELKSAYSEDKSEDNIKDSEKAAIADTEANRLLNDIKSQFSFVDRIRLNHFILPKCHRFVDIRERTKDTIIYFMDCYRSAASVLANEMCNQGRIPDADLVYYMSFDELRRLAIRVEPSIVMQAQRRRRFNKKIDTWKFNEIIKGYDFEPRHLNNDSKEAIELREQLKLMPKIVGMPASSGQVTGTVCIVSNYKQLNKVKPGDILVTYSTDISFSPVFPILAGIVTEIGGMISHGAVIAREYGLPTLIGVQNACSMFEDGEKVMLDANLGHILRLEMTTG